MPDPLLFWTVVALIVVTIYILVTGK